MLSLIEKIFGFFRMDSMLARMEYRHWNIFVIINDEEGKKNNLNLTSL